MKVWLTFVGFTFGIIMAKESFWKASLDPSNVQHRIVINCDTNATLCKLEAMIRIKSLNFRSKSISLLVLANTTCHTALQDDTAIQTVVISHSPLTCPSHIFSNGIKSMQRKTTKFEIFFLSTFTTYFFCSHKSVPIINYYCRSHTVVFAHVSSGNKFSYATGEKDPPLCCSSYSSEAVK